MEVKMINVKIIEMTGKRQNKNISQWYQGVVLELAEFFVKKIKEENGLIKNNESIKSNELEVIAK